MRLWPGIVVIGVDLALAGFNVWFGLHWSRHPWVQYLLAAALFGVAVFMLTNVFRIKRFRRQINEYRER